MDVRVMFVTDAHYPPNGSSEPFEAEQEEIPEPLVPLEPSVAVQDPQLLAVSATSASFAWQPADWSLPAHDERQAEFQQLCMYTLEYELQVQQVDIGPPTASSPAEQLLQQVCGALKDDAWRAVASVAGALQETVQVMGLRSGRFYAARVVATACAVVEVEGQPVYFPATSSHVLPFRTTPTPPGQMQAPALAQRARNALKLKWSVPDETGGEAMTQYELLVTPQPGGWEGGPPDEQGFTQLYVGDERSYKLGKLGPGQRFSFKIRPFNVLGCGPWSLLSTFTTQASVPAQPDPPLQVASTQSTATLQWRAPADNGAAISCYQLEVDDGMQGEFRLAYTGLDTQCMVQQLQSGLQYRFRLRAENSEGYSLWSVAGAAATTATVPSSPMQVAAVGVNRTSVTLAWQPPSSDGGSPVLSYQVQLQAKTKVAAAALGNDWIIIFDGAATATTFSALQSGCKYMVRVAARNAAGQSQFCIPLQLTTASDTPWQPPRPEAEPAATSLLLRWVPPVHDGGSAVTGYKVEMRCSPHTSSTTAAISPQHSLAIPEHFLNIYNGPDMCVQVTDLLPGTAYEFRAAALNSHGAGLWSDVGTATTLPAAPLPPPAPQLSAATSSSLTVSWVEPYGQGSPVSSYTLNMARLGAGAGSSSGSSSHAAGSSSPCLPNGLSDSSGQHVEQHDDAVSTCSSGQASSDKLRWETVYTGPATSAEVRHLKPASRYMLRVRAHNSIGGSSWGDAITATTSPAAPCQPCNLGPTPLSSSAIQLHWCPPLEDNGAPVTGYQLEMAGPGPVTNSSSWAKVWQGSAVQHTVDGLQPGRSYSWRLRAINSCGAGLWCEVVKGTTLPAVPGPPGKPSFSQRTATSVKAKWNIPGEENGAAVSRYVLQVRGAAAEGTDGDDSVWQQVYEGAELSHKVIKLQPGSSYDMRVAAANCVGLGPWSDVSSVVVPLRPPPPPASLSAELEGGAEAVAAGTVQPCLLVSWPASEAAADSAEAVGYEVEAAPAAAGSTAAALKTTCKQTSSSISGLQHGVSYSVRVRAVGAAGTGHSNWSTAAVVAVPARPTPPPSANGDDAAGALVVSSGAAGEGTGKRKGKGKGKGGKESSAAADRRRGERPSPSAARLPPKPKSWRQNVWDHIPKEVRKVVADLKANWRLQYVLLMFCIAGFFLWLGFADHPNRRLQRAVGR